MKILSKFHVSIIYTFEEISNQIALRSGRVIVSIDSASRKMVIKMYSNFFRFLMISELFKSRRDDPYMTANIRLLRSFVINDL